MSKRDKAKVPVLTDVICPGDILRPRGLWLPLAEAAPRASRATTDPDWQARMPSALQPRADAMAKAVRDRVLAAIGTRTGRRRRRDDH